MIASPRLRSWLPVIFARAAAARGVDVEPISRAHGLPPRLGEEEQVTLSVATLRSYGDALAVASGDPHFGLHAVPETPRGAFGLIEYLIRNASTVRSLVHALARYGRLINDVSRVDFDDASGDVVQYIPGEPEYLGAQANEFSVVYQLHVGEDLAGFAMRPELVAFAHARTVDDAELRDAVGTAEVRYGAEKNVIRLPRELLEAPIPSADPSLLRVLEEHARCAVRRRASNVEPYRERIAAALLCGEPTASHIARSMDISERTLLRQLSAHGTTFRALLDDVRRDLALAYLEDPARSVEDVALLLGYADTRSFIRAFRRQTGKTPSAFRRARA